MFVSFCLNVAVMFNGLEKLYGAPGTCNIASGSIWEEQVPI